jgi:hypothetical protein
MTRRLSILCLCAAAAAHAQSGIGVPRSGCVLDGAGRLGPVFGIAGAFLPGKQVQSGVISAACSERLSLVKTERNLEVRDANLQVSALRPAPAGPALFAFLPNGSGAFVYYPSAHALVRLDGMQPPHQVTIYDGLDGDVLAIAAPDAQHLSAVLRSVRGLSVVRISLLTGKPDQEAGFDGAADRALLFADGTLVSVAGTEIRIRRADRTERRLTLPAPAAVIYPMSDRLAGIVPTRGPALAAVRLEHGREQVVCVPEASR